MQKEMFPDPPCQRVRLVEAEPQKARSGSGAPIAVIPGAILDAKYPDGLKTQWFSPGQRPWQDGFYDVLRDGGEAKAWYDKASGLFWLSPDETLDPKEDRFVWRGAVEALGSIRRRLV